MKINYNAMRVLRPDNGYHNQADHQHSLSAGLALSVARCYEQ